MIFTPDELFTTLECVFVIYVVIRLVQAIKTHFEDFLHAYEANRRDIVIELSDFDLFQANQVNLCFADWSLEAKGRRLLVFCLHESESVMFGAFLVAKCDLLYSKGF